MKGVVYSIILLIGIFGSGCKAAHSEQTVYILNKNLQTAYLNLDRTLQKQRPPIVFQKGQTATNCNQYLEAATFSGLKSGISNKSLNSYYLTCAALGLLPSPDDVDMQYDIPTDSREFGRRLAYALDLRSFPSSLGPRLRDGKFTLSQLENIKIKIENNKVSIVDKGWLFAIRVVAVADVDGDGRPDWIMWLSDEAGKGAYAAYETLVICDPDNSRQNLTATPFFEFVPK